MNATPDGVATILVADDEEDVRELISGFLGSRGFCVLGATDGAAALRCARAHHGPIHLLLTDIVMPVMSGVELRDQIAGERPGTKVLFMTGYAPESLYLRSQLTGNTELIRKPFSLKTLEQTVRRCLNEPS